MPPRPPARRYVAVIQAPEGYPPRDAPDDSDKPMPVVLHSVVLEADYEAAEREIERLQNRLRAALDG